MVALPARADTLRGLVRLTAPEDRALLERVRGQASDLAVSLEVDETAGLEPSLREQLDTARTLAAQRDARVVIWAERTGESLEIVVADLALDRVLVRALESARSPEERSAQDEAAALVVRSALKASLSGEALGSSPKELLPVEEPVPTPPQPAPLVAAPAPAPRPREERWLAAVGTVVSADGVNRAGRYAASARLGWQRSRWELGLRGGYGFGVDARVALARLTLAQHRLEGYVGVAPVARETLRLGLLVGAGARLYTMRVDSTEERLLGESGRKVLVGLSALAALRWLPTWARWRGRRAGVELTAGVDVLPTALELGYRTAERFVVAETLWRVQPVGSLELVLLF
ncbi:MAG: hypothetical protein RLZZ450_1382 [Pseudomonadota bacterium]